MKSSRALRKVAPFLCLLAGFAGVPSTGGGGAGDAQAAESPKEIALKAGLELQTVSAWSEDRVGAFRKAALGYPRAIYQQDGEMVAVKAPLAAEDSAGRPALHYVVLELRTSRQAAALAELGLHVEMEPIFSEERVKPSGPRIVAPSHDGGGVLAFAIAPAVVIESLWAAAAKNSGVFPTLVLREVPVAAARDDGDPSRLSWDWLEEAGFVWSKLEEPRPAALGKVEAAEQAQWFAQVDAIVEAHKKVLGKAQAIFFDREGSNRVDVAVRVDPQDTDASFVTADGAPRSMVRAWGNGRGGAVDLLGVRVIAKPNEGLRRTGEVGAANVAHLSLKPGQSYELCVDLDGTGGKVMKVPPFAENVCFGTLDNAGASPLVLAQVKHAHMNMLVQLNEGRKWLELIAQHDGMHKTRVLVGGLADVTGPIAYAPCASLFGVRWLQFLPEQYIPNFGIPELADLIYTIDIVMPGDPTAEDLNSPFNLSRGGISHEYGHVVLCNLMWHAVGASAESDGSPEDAYQFEWAWQDMILQSAGAKTIDEDATWINEGFADFFASQVAGGVNYFDPGTNEHHRFEISGSGIAMCDAAFDDCQENNEIFPGQLAPGSDPVGAFDDAQKAWVSLLHDAVDGQLPSSGAGTPNNGAAWKQRRFNHHTNVLLGGLVTGAFDAPRQNDEVVRLPGSAIVRLVERWAELADPFLPELRRESMLPALADVARENGVPEAQICRLFELHLDPGDSCLGGIPGVDLGFDPATAYLEEGDLLAPAALHCTWPNHDQLLCAWEDASLDGAAFEYSATDQATGESFFTDTLTYRIYKTFTVAVGPDPESVKVSVATVQADGDVSPATVGVFQRPPLPITVGCGNGVVEPGEECDGPLTTGTGDCPTGCTSVVYCVACQEVYDCECGMPGP